MTYPPVLVTPPAILPVTIAEAKVALRIDGSDEDAFIGGLIRAAVAHLDGWTGILGRCLVEQEWRQDFDKFAPCLRLPLWPVISVSSITWRNRAGQLATVAQSGYALKADMLGAYIRFKRDYAAPTDLAEIAAVSVTFKAGYPNTGDDEPKSTVPEAIKTAILMLLGHWEANREAVNVGNITTELPLGVAALLAPYRRAGL
ncbi:head-tail connector protein [Pelagibacterium limicola]|uniref:head-tail connector protein n=1 Tax=Pelagibacterium limicola TaxID=2791022 RepID=UPI0018AFF9F5|nr:head-tail connector protein [Pelagibacterium limicola]